MADGEVCGGRFTRFVSSAHGVSGDMLVLLVSHNVITAAVRNSKHNTKYKEITDIWSHLLIPHKLSELRYNLTKKSTMVVYTSKYNIKTQTRYFYFLHDKYNHKF